MLMAKTTDRCPVCGQYVRRGMWNLGIHFSQKHKEYDYKAGRNNGEWSPTWEPKTVRERRTS